MSTKTTVVKWAIIASLVIVLIFFATLYNGLFNTTDAFAPVTPSGASVSAPLPTVSSSATTGATASIITKIRTQFPKNAIKNPSPLFAYAQNIGGSNDDFVLACQSLYEYNIVFGESISDDRDICCEGKSVFAAKLNADGTLLQAYTYHADHAAYLGHSVGANGIYLAIGSDNTLTVVCLSSELAFLYSTELTTDSPATEVYFRNTGSAVNVFAICNSSVNMFCLSPMLEIECSETISSANHLEIIEIYTFIDCFRIFLNICAPNTFIRVVNLDFALKTISSYDIINEFPLSLISILPVNHADGSLSYAMLVATSTGIRLNLYSTSFVCAFSTYICPSKKVSLLSFGKGFLVLGKGTAAYCCMHGEIIIPEISALTDIVSLTDYLTVDNKILLLGKNDSGSTVIKSYSTEHTLLSNIVIANIEPVALLSGNNSPILVLNSAYGKAPFAPCYGNFDGYVCELKNGIIL